MINDSNEVIESLELIFDIFFLLDILYSNNDIESFIELIFLRI